MILVIIVESINYEYRVIIVCIVINIKPPDTHKK